jgi:hypothetical protein
MGLGDWAGATEFFERFGSDKYRTAFPAVKSVIRRLAIQNKRKSKFSERAHKRPTATPWALLGWDESEIENLRFEI